jgi:hypothetical protein
MTDGSNEDISYRKRFAPSEKDVLKHIQKIHQSKDNETTKQRFLVEIRNSTDKAEEELSQCLKTEKIKSDCYLNYGSRMSNLKNIIENTKDLGRLKSFYFPCVPQLVDEDTQGYINEINKISKDRTSYGIREEIADKKSILLSWSDASKAWYPYTKIQENIKTGKKEDSYIVKKDMKVKLDANQILVPDNKDLDRLGHATSCSNPLPLYKLSFEAVHERRETPLLPGLLTWLERQTARLKEKQEREKYV